MNEKYLLVEKYRLKHENNAWYSDRENSHKHLIFKDSFFEKSDIIGLLFRLNIITKKAFILFRFGMLKFLRHRDSGYILDFRYLQ